MMSFLSKCFSFAPFFSVSLSFPVLHSGTPSGIESLRGKKRFWSDSERELRFFEARCRNVALRCWSHFFSSPAVSRRPSSTARGEVITMTASSQDSAPSSMAGLFLLLLLPAVFTQNSAVPTTPTPSSLDPLTHPECTKKEHPKVSIRGQWSPPTAPFASVSAVLAVLLLRGHILLGQCSLWLL